MPMILPCPHCRQRFHLPESVLSQGPVKLKCPSCRGVFLVRPPGQEPAASTDMTGASSTASSDRTEGTAAGIVADPPQEEPVLIPEYPYWDDREYGPELVKGAGRRFTRHFSGRWALSGVLVSAVFLILVLAWIRPGTGARAPADAKTAVEPHADLKASGLGADWKHTATVATPRHPRMPLDNAPTVPLERVVQPFSGSGPEETCRQLVDLQRELEGKDPGSCAVYPPWIAYLATQHTPGLSSACNGDAPYRLAVRGIREGNSCPWGDAYLAAYYASRKIADRSFSFLQEAIRRSPQDPWVRLAEVLYYQKALQASDTARDILYELIRAPAVSELSRYMLACEYVRKGDYGRAGEVFELLALTFTERPAFQRIRTFLALTQSAPSGSTARAATMLELGLIFSTLKEYAMAAELYQQVLREVPDRLSTEEKGIAYLELGRILELQGDKVKASASYRNALRVNPRSAEAHQRLRALTGNPRPSLESLTRPSSDVFSTE